MINEILEYKRLDNDDTPYIDINNFMDLVYQHNLYEYTNDIVDDVDLKNEVRQCLDESGWERVKFMLDGICNINDDYYYKDGYGNFRNITNRDINSIIDDMVTGLNKSKEDYDL